MDWGSNLYLVASATIRAMWMRMHTVAPPSVSFGQWCLTHAHDQRLDRASTQQEPEALKCRCLLRLFGGDANTARSSTFPLLSIISLLIEAQLLEVEATGNGEASSWTRAARGAAGRTD